MVQWKVPHVCTFPGIINGLSLSYNIQTNKQKIKLDGRLIKGDIERSEKNGK